MTGVIDVHCHCDPDSLPRPIDAIDLARLAKSRGMRGIVLKNQWESTASMAYLVRKVVPGIVKGVVPAQQKHRAVKALIGLYYPLPRIS